MKQLIYVKTSIFVSILLFVSGFSYVFGRDNLLIGVSIIIATLMYLERDLTANPWKSFFFLLVINLQQGIFGYLSALHIWMAIPLNMISMFIVGYFFSFNLKNSLTIAFGLQYLFILTSPVSIEVLPLRLLALVFGAVMIMLVQFIVNKNKFEKNGNKRLIGIGEQLIQKLKAIQSQKEHHHFDSSIEQSIKEIRKMVYHRTVDSYYVTNGGRIYLKISACFEKLNLLLNHFDEIRGKDEFIELLIFELKNVNHFIRREPLDGEKLQFITHAEQTTRSLYAAELIYVFELIYELIGELQMTEKRELRKVEKVENVPVTFKKSYHHIVNFNKNSVRFTYAVRLSITITIAAFISDYFALEQGRWMLFTIFSVTQPYAEIAKHRFSERWKGTLIGAAVFFVLFSVFTGPTSRTLIILLFGYLNSFAVSYRTIILTATVPALGTAALVSDMGAVTFERILYVILGICAGMLANRFILPHSIENGTLDLVRMYKETSRFLIEELYEYFKSPSLIHVHSIHYLFAISTLIEDRILLNNQTREMKDAHLFLENMRRMNNSIYELFLRVQRNKLSHTTVKVILEKVDRIKDSSGEQLERMLAELMHPNDKTHQKYEIIVSKDVLSIYQGFQTSMEYHPEFV